MFVYNVHSTDNNIGTSLLLQVKFKCTIQKKREVHEITRFLDLELVACVDLLGYEDCHIYMLSKMGEQVRRRTRNDLL